MIPRLRPCSSSPPPGATSTRKRSTIAATATSDCPTPTVSTSTTSKPGGLAQQQRLAGAAGDAAERAAGGRRAHERVRGAGQLLHAGLVAEDRAAAARARRVDREHRDAVAVLDEVSAERLDERRLARAGRAGDADAHGAADVGEDLGEERLGVGAVVGAGRLDERDRARQRAPVAVDHQARQLAHGAHARERAYESGAVSAWRRRLDDLGRGLRDVGAGAEDRGDARLAQLVVVLRRDHAADDHEDVVAALLAQLRDELGDERLVPGGLARHADDVHVVLDRVARRLFGRLEQRADVDVEAEVGERGGDHLGAAVVAVLAELDDEQARPATLARRRTPRPRRGRAA